MIGTRVYSRDDLQHRGAPDHQRRVRPPAVADPRRSRRRGAAGDRRPRQRPRREGAREGAAVKALRKLRREDTHLELVDVDPPAPAPGWVVLDVTYAGICGTDVHITHNSFPSYPPVTLGHEFLGVVAAVGEGASSVAPGTRVVVRTPRAGLRHLPPVPARACRALRREALAGVGHRRRDGGAGRRPGAPVARRARRRERPRGRAHRAHRDRRHGIRAGARPARWDGARRRSRADRHPRGPRRPGRRGGPRRARRPALQQGPAGAGGVPGDRDLAGRRIRRGRAGRHRRTRPGRDRGPGRRPRRRDQRLPRRDRDLRGRGPAAGDDARARRPRRPRGRGAVGSGDEPCARRRVLAVVVLVELGRGARADGPRRPRPRPSGHRVPPGCLEGRLRCPRRPHRRQGPDRPLPQR